MLRPGGLLSLVLPIRSVKSVTRRRFEAVLALLGLPVRTSTESPKIAFFACVRSEGCWHSREPSSERLTQALNRGASSDPLCPITFAAESLDRLCHCAGRAQQRTQEKGSP
jgi:hypothetical protein